MFVQHFISYSEGTLELVVVVVDDSACIALTCPYCSLDFGCY